MIKYNTGDKTLNNIQVKNKQLWINEVLIRAL